MGSKPAQGQVWDNKHRWKLFKLAEGCSWDCFRTSLMCNPDSTKVPHHARVAKAAQVWHHQQQSIQLRPPSVFPAWSARSPFMSLLGGNRCQHGPESPVSLGPWRAAATLLCCLVFQSSQCICWALKTVSLLLRDTVNVKLLMSEKLLQLCSELREEIIWCKVSPRQGRALSHSPGPKSLPWLYKQIAKWSSVWRNVK